MSQMTDQIRLTYLDEKDLNLLKGIEQGEYWNIYSSPELVHRLGGKDFIYMCEFNSLPDGVDFKDIRRAVEIIPSFNDGPTFVWLVWINDGRTFYVQGWCDFTGWDCQSGSSWTELPKTNEYELDYIDDILSQTYEKE